MNHKIYADNASTTRISKEVLDDMMPYLTDNFGNPSSSYSIGSNANRGLELAREDIANCLNAYPKEIFFTSGGSESDNWAIKGVARSLKAKGKTHIITSKFEHHAVLHPLNVLEKEGFEVTYLDVHENGLVVVEELENAIKKNTGLVTIMYANNEIGTIQPIAEIGAVCKKHKVIFHTDAVQAVGNILIDVKAQNIDMLSLTAHKLNGPKGCGALYVRTGVRPDILIDGGAQERGRRAGTENVAGAVGLASAFKNALKTLDAKTEKLTKMRNRLIDNLITIEHSQLNGDRVNRLAGNFNMCFHGIEGEALLLMLDLKGVCASSGSACTSGSLDPSHVLLSLGLPHEIANSSLRLTFSDDNTEEDIDYILEVLPPIITKLRSMSPLWKKIVESD